jgi:queuine tRNA-ribosyltransferase
VKQARYKDDASPLDSGCSCATCRGGFSRAYLRHLFMAGEILVLRLLSLHNLHLYGELVASARQAILSKNYAAFKRSWIEMASQEDRGKFGR